MTEKDNGAGQQQDGQQFHLQKIYLKDISFETPNSPAIFTEKWEPQVNVELQTSGTPLAENIHEVILSVTVTVKVGENTAYLAEVHQAGVFTLAGFAEQEMPNLLGSYCPNVLFPFAREAVADLVTKGGFPQMLLAPVNFDALLNQHLQEQKNPQGSGEEAVH